MDAEKLKSRIREALGAAGIPREVAQQVDHIVDSMTGKKEEAEKPQARVERAAAQPARTHREEEDDDEDEREHRAAMARAAETRTAETRTKPARKTKTARKKK